MKKLPKNYGSIIKLKGDRRKPYAVRIFIGYNLNGSCKYTYIGYYSTKDEALNALSKYSQNPYNLDLRKTTISDLWEIFKNRKFNEISKSGINVYKAAFKHIAPIHSVPIINLKTFHLQNLIDNVNRKWQTKSHILTLLHQLFEVAIELDIIEKNYTTFVKIGEKTTSNIHQVFTKDEIQKLFDNVSSYEWIDTILILIYTGMRPSELLFLKTENININEKYLIGGLKTSAGKDRIIPISEKIMPFIKKRYNSNNIYFIEINKKPISYIIFKTIFDNIMKNLKMTHLPHDCRHTFITLMNNAGANSVDLKLIVGHAQKDITDKVYIHKNVKDLLKTVNLI